jgi:hypothetical protein
VIISGKDVQEGGIDVGSPVGTGGPHIESEIKTRLVVSSLWD